MILALMLLLTTQEANQDQPQGLPPTQTTAPEPATPPERTSAPAPTAPPVTRKLHGPVVLPDARTRADQICTEHGCDEALLEKFGVEWLGAAEATGFAVDAVPMFLPARPEQPCHAEGFLLTISAPLDRDLIVDWESAAIGVDGRSFAAAPGRARHLVANLKQRQVRVPRGSTYTEAAMIDSISANPVYDTSSCLFPAPEGETSRSTTLDLIVLDGSNQTRVHASVTRRYVRRSEAEAFAAMTPPRGLPIGPEPLFRSNIGGAAVGIGTGAILSTGVGLLFGFSIASPQGRDDGITSGLACGCCSLSVLGPAGALLGWWIGGQELEKHAEWEQAVNWTNKRKELGIDPKVPAGSDSVSDQSHVDPRPSGE
jgi:hypothetical protein